MEIITTALVIVTIALIGVSAASRIPKTGRYPDVKGDTVQATITNRNIMAEKAATLRAKGSDGRKYKVKLKPTEAKMWFKGDTIEILLDSNDKKKYRVLFNDYFQKNEERMRSAVMEQIRTRIKPNLFAARFTGYTEKTPDALETSKADFNALFSFSTLMRLIDIYTVASSVVVIIFLWWFLSAGPSFKQMLLPLAVVLLVLWAVYSTVETCKKILKKFAPED